MVRRDNPEMQIDKLVIVDKILHNNPSKIDPTSERLIREKIARFEIPQGLRYDKPIVER